MVKKNGKGVAKNFELTATSVLDSKDNNMGLMKESKLDEFKSFHSFNINAVLPLGGTGADWKSQGWVCFYYYPFDISMRFPFSKLVTDLLDSLDISPGQLMPYAWRLLTCLDAIEEKHQFWINVDVVFHAYQTKKFNACRYGLICRKKDDTMKEEPLVLNLDVINDRGWKNEFFFMEKTSLGKYGESFREEWNSAGNILFCTPTVCFNLPDMSL